MIDENLVSGAGRIQMKILLSCLADVLACERCARWMCRLGKREWFGLWAMASRPGANAGLAWPFTLHTYSWARTSPTPAPARNRSLFYVIKTASAAVFFFFCLSYLRAIRIQNSPDTKLHGWKALREFPFDQWIIHKNCQLNIYICLYLYA